MAGIVKLTLDFISPHMLNIYIRDYEWAQYKPRQIDDETLVDLLRICEYQAKRAIALEDVGIEDHADPVDALYMYVLDALGVPDTGHKKHLLVKRHDSCESVPLNVIGLMSCFTRNICLRTINTIFRISVFLNLFGLSWRKILTVTTNEI